MTAWTRRLLDVDQLLIFFLLSVTINQMGHFLASFAPPGWGWIGYVQAVAIDLAIWRSAWWYRRYTGRRQRRWALVGVVTFSLVSGAYNFGYYSMQAPAMWWPLRAGMAAVLPLGVALLSYLYGQKAGSRFAVTEDEPAPSEPKAEPPARPASKASYACPLCGFVASTQQGLNAHQRVHNERSESR